MNISNDGHDGWFSKYISVYPSPNVSQASQVAHPASGTVAVFFCHVQLPSRYLAGSGELENPSIEIYSWENPSEMGDSSLPSVITQACSENRRGPLPVSQRLDLLIT